LIYLNHAATSWPKPERVLRAVARALAGPPAGQFRSSADFGAADPVRQAREALARVLNVSRPEGVYLTSGATEAANLFVRGLTAGGGVILATQTEHNSVLRPLYNQKAARVRIVPCDERGFVAPEQVARSITPDVRAIFVNHVGNVTGAIQDAAAIGEIARARGLAYILDLSQSAGCVPVYPERWHASGAFFTGHKALMGPQGTGGFYLSPSFAPPPLCYGGTGFDSARLTYGDGDAPYEVGTRNVPAIAGLAAAAEHVLSLGVDRIRAREAALRARLTAGLAGLPGVTLFGAGEADRFGPVIGFRVRGLSADDAAFLLSGEYGIVTRAGLQCAPLIHRALGTDAGGVVRASLGAETTEAEIDALIRALAEITGGGEDP